MKHDETPQRERPLEWTASDRRIGPRPGNQPPIWTARQRAIRGMEIDPPWISTSNRQIGRPQEIPIVLRGQNQTGPRGTVQPRRGND